MAYLDVFLFNSHFNNGHYVLYCYRIYVGSINFELGEETVRNGFHQFGTIKAINMSWDGAAGKHKVFAYLVFFEMIIFITSSICYVHWCLTVQWF